MFVVIGLLQVKIPDTFYLQDGESFLDAMQMDNMLSQTLSLSDGSVVALELIPIKQVCIKTVTEPVVVPCGLPIGVADADAINCSVGMMTFYDPNSHKFAGFGHTADVTGENMNVYSAKIDGIQVQDGKLGSLLAKLGGEVGKVYKSSSAGVFGSIYTVPDTAGKSSPMEICPEDLIEYGAATLLTTIDGGENAQYDVTISPCHNDLQVNLTTNSSPTNADFIIEITDEILLEKTGGILRGMSGSPIIKNGKLIGALNQTTEQNPKIGYGIFAQKMIPN